MSRKTINCRRNENFQVIISFVSTFFDNPDKMTSNTNLTSANKDEATFLACMVKIEQLSGRSRGFFCILVPDDSSAVLYMF